MECASLKEQCNSNLISKRRLYTTASTSYTPYDFFFSCQKRSTTFPEALPFVVLLLDLKLGDLFWLNVLFHLSDFRKQDGSDPRISATLEPQLLQPKLPFTASPFQKVVTGEIEFALWPLTYIKDLCVTPSFFDLFNVSQLILSPHLLLSGCTCSVFYLYLISCDVLDPVSWRVTLISILAFFCVTCGIKAHRALCLDDYVWLIQLIEIYF